MTSFFRQVSIYRSTLGVHSPAGVKLNHNITQYSSPAILW